MKKRLQGYLLGFISATLLLSGVVYAASNTKTIEALYNNIKIYVDGVKIEPKDANGNTVEPFIYNGTTYLPVRAVGEAIGKTVTWDGATQSVYLGGKLDDIQYLMDVCPPYQGHRLTEYSASNGDYFEMGGKKYSNGFVFTHTNGALALVNLNGEYTSVELDIGAIPRERWDGTDYEYTISFIVDGKLVKNQLIKASEMPQKITIPLNYGLQLKICTSDNIDIGTGFGNIVLK